MIFIHSLYLLFILIPITAMVSYRFKWGAKYTVTSPRTITVCLAESCFNTYLEFRYILISRRPMFSPNYLHFMT